MGWKTRHAEFRETKASLRVLSRRVSVLQGLTKQLQYISNAQTRCILSQDKPKKIRAIYKANIGSTTSGRVMWNNGNDIAVIHCLGSKRAGAWSSNVEKSHLFGGGIASSDPRTNQEIRNAMNAERVTISHWPRTTIELSTGVRGTANAGTARTILNCFCTALLSTRVRVCCGRSRCGREEESRLSRGRCGAFSSGCGPSMLAFESLECAVVLPAPAA